MGLVFIWTRQRLVRTRIPYSEPSYCASLNEVTGSSSYSRGNRLPMRRIPSLSLSPLGDFAAGSNHLPEKRIRGGRRRWRRRQFHCNGSSFDKVASSDVPLSPIDDFGIWMGLLISMLSFFRVFNTMAGRQKKDRNAGQCWRAANPHLWLLHTNNHWITINNLCLFLSMLGKARVGRFLF